VSADNNPKTQYGDLKPPVHLVPPVAILQEAMVFKLGAQKYGPYNWRDNSVAVSVYYSAAMRHLTSYWDGEDLDPQSKESHLAHARASLAILIDALSCGNLIDDRPPPGQAAQFIAAVESRKLTTEITTDAATPSQSH
jgi:hypothetical protein